MAITFPHAYLSKPLDPETVKAKKQRGRCICFGCRRKAETSQRKYKCQTCQSRIKRMTHDDRYAYSNLRASARKRGIGFHLSFEDFAEFCATTGYLEQRGKEPHSLSIDRRFTDRPYELGNLRIMTYEANISHRHEEYADASAAADF